MNIVKFRAQHLHDLELQDAQKYFRAEFNNPDYGGILEASPHSFTCIEGGQVLLCGGAHELWPGRAVAWTLVSKHAGKHFWVLHRAVEGFLKQAQWRRIEMMVEDGFEAGHRWARMLGFTNETPDGMAGYSPSGVKFYLYSRVQNG